MLFANRKLVDKVNKYGGSKSFVNKENLIINGKRMCNEIGLAYLSINLKTFLII